MKRVCLACLLLSALCCGFFGHALAQASPTPGTLTLTVDAVPPMTPEPVFAPETEPLFTADPFTATLTPEATFVPLPTGTPFADGTTPTPAPPTASPYPSPEVPLFSLPETVLTGTVTGEETTLRARPSLNASRRGVLKPGDTVRIVEESEGWYSIESGSIAGWAEKTAFCVEEISLKEAEHIVIRAGSLNIHSCRQGEAMLTIADTIAMADLDVVGLQEVRRTEKIDWLQRLAAEADYPYYYFSKTSSVNGGEYGIALMSRYPILFSETFRLDGYPGDEPRVLQYAAVLTENGIAHFLNTHLSAKEMYKKSVNLASLVYHVRGLGTDKLFMTGDFNCGPPRLSEFWPDVRFSNMTVNTYGDGSVPKILDNVLYTGAIRVTNVSYASLQGATDHMLVAAELVYE